MESSGLKAEKNYVKFAEQVGEVLYAGEAPYNIPAFFNELSKGLNREDLDSRDLKKILDKIQGLYNQKIAAEKKEAQGKAKKPSKPKINAGIAKGADNQMAINMLTTGGADDYGDEEYGDYGDYGDEAGKVVTRVEEENYDFI